MFPVVVLVPQLVRMRCCGWLPRLGCVAHAGHIIGSCGLATRPGRRHRAQPERPATI